MSYEQPPADSNYLRLIPRDFSRQHRILGLSGNDAPVLLIGPTTSPWVVHNVRRYLGGGWPAQSVEDDAALAEQIDAAYENYGPTQGGAAVAGALETVGNHRIDDLLQAASNDLLSTSGKAPVVRLVDALLFQALRLDASDLHLQPLPDRIVARHRIDGVLDASRELPIALLPAIVGRIKVMAGMDVAEHLVPQDGRATVRIGDRPCDIRVSTLPTPHGERVVVRLLDSARQLQEFHNIGMPQQIATNFLESARRTSGIILVTGPTGSGKTTTLYATLRELDSRERNIMTIEDPIEYELDTLGLPISQSQVNSRKGVTFANGLRHLLRQDPDIILVGEIRDSETAKVAIQASLTGHLVLSTLHTNDAASAVTRLVDLGVEPYLVAASLSAVLAQRLVRTVCPNCGNRLNEKMDCGLCSGSGFKGRRGLFELLPVDDTLRQLIGNGASLQQVRNHALSNGMKTLHDSGRALVEAGETTTQEVERVVYG